MSKKNNETLNDTSFWLFPEKVKPIILFLISLLTFVVAIVIVILVYSNKNYQYIPDYTEIQYSEDVNTGMIILSSYTEDSDTGKAIKSNRIITTFSKIKKNDKTYDILNTKFSIIGANKNNIEYLSEYTRTSKYENYQMTHTFASLTSNSKQDYDRLYVKTAYDYIDTDGDQSVTRKVQTYLQKIMTISDDEIKNATKDELLEQVKVFSNHVVRRKSENDSDYRVYADLYIKATDLEKYKLDYQLFGIDDDGNVYTLLGYYNISTNVYTSISRGTTYPKDLNINTFIAKAILLDKDGETHTYIGKATLKEE